MELRFAFRLGGGLLGAKTFESADDARRAEAALAGPGRAEGVGPATAAVVGEPPERRHPATGDAPCRRHARHPRGAVDQHRAAPALALRAAAVLRRAIAQVLAQDVEQGPPVVDDVDLAAVELELDRHRDDRLG